MQKYDWEKIRAEYEAGSTMGELSRAYGADKAAISRRAKKDHWEKDLTGAVDRRFEAKINGLINTVDPQKRAEAVDAAADKKVAIVLRHQAEWGQHREITAESLATKDFELAKLAKITAETLKIRQDGERRAYGIADKTESNLSGTTFTWEGENG